jgi:hypothetical protein
LIQLRALSWRGPEKFDASLCIRGASVVSPQIRILVGKNIFQPLPKEASMECCSLLQP